MMGSNLCVLGAPSRWNTLRALRALKWWIAGSIPILLV